MLVPIVISNSVTLLQHNAINLFAVAALRYLALAIYGPCTSSFGEGSLTANWRPRRFCEKGN